MLDKKLEEIADRLRTLLPAGSDALHEELRSNLNLIAETIISRMDLVTREEFEVQRAVLARTRARLKEIEAELEAVGQTGTAP